MKRQRLKTIVLFCLLAGYVSAQNPVQILDLTVSPVTQADPLTNQPVESDHQKLSVTCKINDTTFAGTMHILFGTSAGTGDILRVSATPAADNRDYLQSSETHIFEIENNVLRADINLSPEQSGSFRFISLYVTGPGNTESNHLLFTRKTLSHEK